MSANTVEEDPDTVEEGTDSVEEGTDSLTSADTVEEGTDPSMSTETAEQDREPSTFLTSIEFLTGEDPSAGSFLLVIGMTTCVFVAAFQFTLPEPVSLILTGLVLTVAVISFIIGAILDALDYFDTPVDDAK